MDNYKNKKMNKTRARQDNNKTIQDKTLQDKTIAHEHETRQGNTR